MAEGTSLLRTQTHYIGSRGFESLLLRQNSKAQRSEDLWAFLICGFRKRKKLMKQKKTVRTFPVIGNFRTAERREYLHSFFLITAP